MDSILTTIKDMLGIAEEDTHFDRAITRHINSAFMTLHQLGVGPCKCFKVTSKDQTWYDFLGESGDFETVKTYIYLKVKISFDPPTNAFVMDAMERQSKEDEWRLNVQAELDNSCVSDDPSCTSLDEYITQMNELLETLIEGE